MRLRGDSGGLCCMPQPLCCEEAAAFSPLQVSVLQDCMTMQLVAKHYLCSTFERAFKHCPDCLCRPQLPRPVIDAIAGAVGEFGQVWQTGCVLSSMLSVARWKHASGVAKLEPGG